MKRVSLMIIGAASLALVACGGGGDADGEAGAGSTELANGMTVAEQINARQEGYKSIGSAFRTIRQEAPKDEKNLPALTEAASTLSGHAENMGDWFPEGTGPESGVETEALPAIWEDPDGFDAAIVRFQEATASFSGSVEASDMTAISAAPQLLGGACKNCHDNYRLDD